MTRARRLAVTVALLVVLAGCAGPPVENIDGNSSAGSTLSPPPSSPSPADGSPTGSGDTESPPADTATVTPSPTDETFPPGVDEAGLVNTSALLAAHTSRLTRSGYVAVGSGNTTVKRNGILLGTTYRGRSWVAPEAGQYYEVTRIVAGPVTRNRELWSNGTLEYRRIRDAGGTRYVAREPRTPATLASAKLLTPFLAAGDYEVAAVDTTGTRTLVTLTADEVTNETLLLSGLPRDAESVRWLNATLVVDDLGRIHEYSALVGFVIDGADRTHELDYDLVALGNVSLGRPAWVDDAVAATDEGDGRPGDRSLAPSVARVDDTGGRNAVRPVVAATASGDTDAHCSRLVVSTSGWRA